MQLNSSQKHAVEHSEGPLLVVAGAGTGKTRVITERIKHLVEKLKVEPNEICALTFTEKAAGEMSERVGDIMPLGYTEPWINNFHSFADRILKAEGLEIGLDPSYKILSGPNQWILLRKNLFKIKLKYFRPLGNPTKFISAILKFISRLQDENISFQEFTKFAESFEGELEEKTRWLELAHTYEMYQKIKVEGKNAKLDFGDLIFWTIKLFTERPNILKKYQTQFKHILVDEFQDTNHAQYELIKMLFPTNNDEASKGRSLIAVGDDSQSIYKFRGAAVSNILEFMQDFPQAQMVSLTQNFRSTQEILDPAYTLIQNNNPDTLEVKLGISKELTSENAAYKGTKQVHPEAVSLQTMEDEVEWVISKIYEILAKEPNYTYKDFAILARANSQLDAFVLALRKHALPYQLVGNRGLYDQDEVRDILALLRLVINPRDTISLYRTLNMDALNIPQHVITNLLAQTRLKKLEMWDVLNESENEHLNLFAKLIMAQQDKITKATPVEFIYSLVNEIGYVTGLTQVDDMGAQLKIHNLDLFLNIVKGFEIEYRADNKEIPTVVDFIDHIDLLIDAGDNPAQAEIQDYDTINLMTVHASKGLEFPVVFLTNLIAGRFPSTNRSDPIEIPEELIKETLPSGDEHLQEERRLFYVGMTRAQRYLYLTYAKNYGGKREKHMSGYIQETNLKITTVENSLPSAVEPTQSGLFGVESGFRDPVYKKIDFSPTFLSYSQIDTYKTCPLMYKYRYVLNVPTPPSHALSFGSTIHDTLRDFHQKLMFKPVSLEEVYEIYEKNWQPLGYLNEEHRQERFNSGKEILANYYKTFMQNPVTPLEVERPFNIKIEGIKFYGRIDRIDPNSDGGVEIVDYKTGSTKTQKDVDKDDQVAFYAIAAREALKLNPTKLTYYFLESGEKVSTTRTPEELEKKREEVKDVIDEIKKGKFEATPGMHCSWCDFKEICPYAYKS